MLHKPRIPQQVFVLATRVLHEMGGHVARLTGDGDQPGEFTILPLRTARTRALAKGDFSGTVLIGWRCLWLHQKEAIGISIDFRRQPGGRPVLASCAFGRTAATLADCLTDAVTAAQDRPEGFVPAFLSLPAIHVEAACLVPASPRAGLGVFAPQISKENAAEALRTRANATLEKKPPRKKKPRSD